MANIDFESAGDTSEIDLSGILTGKVTGRDGDESFVVVKGDLTFEIFGSDFSAFDASGWPTKGQVSFVMVASDDDALYSVNFEMPAFSVKDFRALLAKGPAAVLEALFGGNDDIGGSELNDVLRGGVGDDRLEGRLGKNILDGGDGDDELTSESATDTLIGGAGEDRASIDYHDSAGAVEIVLGRADAVTQVKVGGKAAGTITGVEALTFEGGEGADRITGGVGDDVLLGNGGDDVLIGGAGDDSLDGGQGRNLLNGGDGDDTFWLYGRDGATEIIGGGGFDQLELDVSFGETGVTLDIGDARKTTDYLVGGVKSGSVTGIEQLTFRGGDGDDRIVGGVGDDVIDGGGGVNVLRAGAGADELTSRNTRDTLDGGGGQDLAILYFGAETAAIAFDLDNPDAVGRITVGGVARGSITGVEAISFSGGDGGDRITAGAGDDAFYGGTGNDVFDGGQGVDTLGFAFGASVGVTVDLAAGTSARSGVDADTIRNFENVNGTRYNDVLRGDDRNNVLHGGFGGKDALHGRGGDDVLELYNAEGATIDGGAGSDVAVLSFDGSGGGVTLTLGAPGAVSKFTVKGGAEGTITGVERISFNGTFFGDRVTGGAGDDSFANGSGDDVLDGGGGIDTLAYITDYASGPPNGRVVVDLAAGVSQRFGKGFGDGSGVPAEVLFDRDTIRNFENVIGSPLSDEIRGDARDNVLDGGGFASGGSGADLLVGRQGDDTYVVDDAGDRVVEVAGEGEDLILSSVDWSLAGQHVERLTLTGTARSGTGNSLANTLVGNASNNVLDGGSGADVMTGGGGHDRYIVDNRGDRVVERNGEGDDLVVASVNHSLAGTYVERLQLTGTAKYGTGNSLDNTITGNAAVNVLTGGTGDDTYHVQTAGDRVVELDGQGTDHVFASVDFSLAGQYIENLTLTGTARSATGNSLANTLTGNASANVLDGGSGADRLVGGQGHDRYRVDSKSDVVVERNGEGDDVVESAVDWNLSGSYVERLELKGAARYGIGNSLDNTITGSDGANILRGGDGADILIGGKGADVLDGQGGADRYVYRAVSDSTNAAADTIKGLASGERLDLSLIDANTVQSGNQAFSLVEAFSGVRGQATLDHSAAANLTTLLLDLDGDRTADMRILITGDANEARIVW